ncbi:MAG: hypothetical protein WCF36_10810 [Candidatus Nanopelagicales bacterium]
MRLIAPAVVIVAAVVVLALGRGAGLPWQPGCTVSDPTGVVLAQGFPEEISTIVAAAGADSRADLRDALGAGAAVTCRISAMSPTSDAKEPPLGLTPRAAALRAEARDQFGDLSDGGFGPQTPLPGRNPNGEHSLGRAVDFFFRPADSAAQARDGWRLANWAVANAQRLGVRTVIYRDQIWTARRSIQGWRDYRFSGSDPDNPINRHLDHVHVDVA